MLILSEPLTIIPYDWLDYPRYDYQPSALWRIPGESDRFKERLTRFLVTHNLNNSQCYFLIPHHHLMILWPSWVAAFGDISNLFGFAYSQATRWFFLSKLEQALDANGL